MAFSRYGSGTGPRTPVLLLAVALIATPSFAQKADPAQDLIQGHRKTLLGPDPKPVGHVARKHAIGALVAMDEEAAHALLHEVLSVFGDPQKAPLTTVQLLVGRVAEQAAIDGLPDRVDKKNKKSLRRVAIYKSYVKPVVQLWSTIELTLKDAKERVALRDEVRRFLRILPHEDLRPELEQLISQPGKTLRLAAVEVAGETEDPLMAPKLAELLSDPGLRKVVQSALFDLTLETETFKNRAEFEAWWKLNKGKTYHELAVAAARKARTLAKRLETVHGEKTQRLRAKLLARAQSVITLGLGRTPPPWRELLRELQDADLAPARAKLLDVFYLGLKDRKIDAKELQRTQNDLMQLRGWLAAEYGRKNVSVDDRRSLLSAFTVCSTLLGGKPAGEVKGRLLALLTNDVKEGIGIERVLELLQLFPDDAVRRRVLETLRRPQALTYLDAGLRCVRELGLSPTDARLADQTLAWLNAKILDAKLDAKLRGQALRILGGIGINDPKVLRSLRALVQMAQPKTLPDSLRATALQFAILGSDSQLQTRKNGDREAQANAQLTFLQTCLADKSARIRLDSAKELEEFPGSKASFSEPFLRKTAQTIVSEVGEALRTELTPGCVRQFRAVMLSQASRAKVWEAALTHVALAAQYWAARTKAAAPNGAVTFLETHLPGVRQDLARLVEGREGIAPAATLALARDLLESGLARCAGILLAAEVLADVDRKSPAATPDAEKLRSAQRVERASLVVRAVAAAGSYERLDAAGRRRVDELLVSARNGILANAAETPLALVGLGRALLAAKQPVQAATALSRFLRSHAKDAPTAQQVSARLLLARALLGSGKAADAAKLLEGHKDLASRMLRARALMQQQSTLPAAEKAYAALLKDAALVAGRQREEALLGHAESLLLQGKLDAAEKALAAIPELSEKASKTKLEVLRASLAERRKAAKKTGAAGKAADKSTPAKPGKDS